MKGKKGYLKRMAMIGAKEVKGQKAHVFRHCVNESAELTKWVKIFLTPPPAD